MIANQKPLIFIVSIFIHIVEVNKIVKQLNYNVQFPF